MSDCFLSHLVSSLIFVVISVIIYSVGFFRGADLIEKEFEERQEKDD
jgi:hypothetical protein